MAVGLNAISTTLGGGGAAHPANLILAAAFQNGPAYTGPAATAWWVQLHTGDPGSDGVASVTNGGTRAHLTGTAPVWSNPANGQTSNRYDITFNSVTGAVNYSHFSLWSASTAGNFYASGTLSGAGTSGADYVISVGQLVISLLYAA